MTLQCVVGTLVAQVLQFSQADVDKLFKEKELELVAKEREWKSKLDEQKRKYGELSTEKLQSDEKVLRLQKSHEDMKYAVVYRLYWIGVSVLFTRLVLL